MARWTRRTWWSSRRAWTSWCWDWELDDEDDNPLYVCMQWCTLQACVADAKGFNMEAVVACLVMNNKCVFGWAVHKTLNRSYLCNSILGSLCHELSTIHFILADDQFMLYAWLYISISDRDWEKDKMFRACTPNNNFNRIYRWPAPSKKKKQRIIPRSS